MAEHPTNSSIGARWRALRSSLTHRNGVFSLRKAAAATLVGATVAAGIAIPVAASATGTLTLSCTATTTSGKTTVSWNNIGQSSNSIWDHAVLKTVTGRTYVDTTPETSYIVVVYVNEVKYKATCSPGGGGVTTTTSGGGGTTTTAPAGGTLACRVSVAGGVATVTWNNIGQSSNSIWDHGVLKTVTGRSYTDTTVETSYIVVVMVGGVKVKATCAPGGGGGGGTTTTSRPASTTTTARPASTTTTARPATTTTTTAPAGTLTCTVTAGAVAGTVNVTWNIGAWPGSTINKIPSGELVSVTGKSYVDLVPNDKYALTIINNGTAHQTTCKNKLPWQIMRCDHLIVGYLPNNETLKIYEKYAWQVAESYDVFDKNGVLLFNTATMYAQKSPGVISWYQPWNQAQFLFFSKIHSVVGIRNGRRSDAKICPAYTPIALDLTGDGKVSKIRTNVRFDLDADGKTDRLTEWFAPGEGILIDLSKSGPLDGSRLFGDQGAKYTNGYAKLATRDRNRNGSVSGTELSGLALWVDDGDAKLETGEIRSLASAKIASISTRAVGLRSTATRTNGTKVATADLVLGTAAP